MKKLIFILLLLAPFLTYSQYGNEWINYNQKYLKVKIAKDGLYRINQSTLSNALLSVNENINSIDPRNIQIFGKGQEIPIYISGEADGSFDTNDFIEFYAERNDGKYDSTLYGSLKNTTNPMYSVFNDTIAYFITWNNSTNNKRFLNLDNTNLPTTKYNYIISERDTFFNNNYYPGHSSQVESYYNPAEGYMSNYFDCDKSQGCSFGQFHLDFYTPNVYTADTNLKATFKTNFAGVSSNDHNLLLIVGSQYQQVLDTTWFGYQLINYQFNFPTSKMGSTTRLSYTLKAVFFTQKTAISYATVKYPHTLDFEGKSEFKFKLPYISGGAVQLNGNNFSGTTSYLYDLTDNNRIKVIQNGANVNARIPSANISGTEKQFLLVADNQINQIQKISAVSGNGYFTDYTIGNPDSAFVLIAHKKIMNEAIQYADYKTTFYGGSHKVILADIDQLYDQFALGIEKHSASIRNFANYLLTSGKLSSKPQYLFLMGKSIWDANQSFRKS